jgi:hypothetical protein
METLRRLTSSTLARQVAPIGRSIGALIAASAGGVALAFGGGFGWSFLAGANRRTLPPIPWAACIMLATIALAWWWFARYRWARTPSSGCGGRRWTIRWLSPAEIRFDDR